MGLEPVEEVYPEAGVIRVVLLNPNTRRKALLYEPFPAAARRTARKPEFATRDAGTKRHRLYPPVP